MLTWRGSRRMGGPHDWNVPDEVHRALRVLAALCLSWWFRGEDVDGRPSPTITITGLIQRGSAVRQVWNAP
jgi:hypothetical protein